MKLCSPTHAAQFFRTRIDFEIEEFWIAALNSRREVIRSTCLFRGTVDHCLFHPRDVFRFAFLNNASSLLVAHSHPSGCVGPSPEDRLITKRLLCVSLMVEIPLTDHLILSRNRHFSFLESGALSTIDLAWPFG